MPTSSSSSSGEPPNPEGDFPRLLTTAWWVKALGPPMDPNNSPCDRYSKIAELEATFSIRIYELFQFEGLVTYPDFQASGLGLNFIYVPGGGTQTVVHEVGPLAT